MQHTSHCVATKVEPGSTFFYRRPRAALMYQLRIFSSVIRNFSAHCSNSTERPGDLLAAGLFTPCLSATRRHHMLNGKGLRCLVSGTGCPGNINGGTRGGCQVSVTLQSRHSPLCLTSLCGVCVGSPTRQYLNTSVGDVLMNVSGCEQCGLGRPFSP